MATLSISIPDAQAVRVVNKFALRMGYQSEVDGVNNPETKNQFLKRKIIEFVQQAVRAQELEEAEIAARAALTSIDLS